MIFFSHYNAPVRILAPTGWVTSRRLTAAITGAQPSAHSSTEATQERELLGTWTATGTITASHNFVNEPTGLTFQRLWQIAQSCANGRCRPAITRTTNAGPVSTWLAWAGGHWTADFVTTIPCQDGTSSAQYSNWTIRVRPGAINAVEHDRTTGSCPTSTSVIRWSAHPALRPADSPNS